MLAAYYFEWERMGKQKVKNAIKPAGSTAMYMAGIYRISNGAAEFTILTREPGACIRHIHDRMPVVLPREATTDWLNPKYDALEVLQAAVTEMTFMPVDGVRQEKWFIQDDRIYFNIK